MELPSLQERFSEGLERDLFFVAISLAVVLVFVGVNNATTPNEDMNVGLVEVETNCFGIDAGTCIGLEMRDHKSYNYDNYTEAEPGTPNYYRRVESELMLQAYNICEAESITEMDWTSEASYDNRTGSEWLENDNVELLPCGETTFRHMNASS